MKCVVGLGNPGEKYQSTHHNVGFSIVEEVMRKTGNAPLTSLKNKIDGLYSKYETTLFLLPTTFMNESGRSVQKTLKYFKIKPENCLVVHDDIDLPFLSYKLQFGRGAAGHHGVESIMDSIETKDFWRLRIGIANIDGTKPRDVKSFVLNKILKSEKGQFEKKLDEFTNIILEWIK